MTPPRSPQVQPPEQDADWLVRLGGWLFTWRTSVPLPIVVALLILRSPKPSTSIPVIGILMVVAGELLRLWGVRHIGAISRTRSDRLGPLVSTGPFALVRNPLYVGNITLWAGFSIAANLTWLAPVIVLLLGFVYHAIVRWEERLLAVRLGDRYREYAARVPRWFPSGGGPARAEPGVDDNRLFSWRDTLFSERGTLIAIGAGLALLYVKFTVF